MRWVEGQRSVSGSGGFTEDLAVHMVSFLIRLLGAPIRTRAVSRVSATSGSALVEEGRGVIETERGLGTLSVSLRGRTDMILLDIWCTRMLLRLNVSCLALTMYRQLPVPQKIGRGLANLPRTS
jgi:hypothetical protein